MARVSTTSTFVKIKFQFEGMHCWPNAPKEVAFLRSMHRHVFHVSAVIEVFHDDRDLEFILVKRYLEKQVANTRWPKSASCEHMATVIASMIRQRYGSNRYVFVEVSEDGENGALVEWTADVETDRGL